MSRNFELMHQAAAAGASMPQPGRAFPTVQEKVQQKGVRFHFDKIAREGALKLVQRMFLLQAQSAPRAVLFAGIAESAGGSQMCLLVAEALESAVSGSVCIVDANLRSPSLPGLLGTTNHYGLTDALLNDGSIRSFAKPLQTGNVWYLSCGSLAPDSPNLLNSDRINDRFDELRKEFDYVLVDAPPLDQYADATVLGRLTDGVVVVLEPSSTQSEPALRVMEKLRESRIKVLGAVLNKRTCPIPEVLHNRL